MSIFNNYTFNQFKKLAPNVPAVKDVLQARISKLRSSLQGLQNVAEQKHAEGEARTRFC